jgi:hypothetical protein
MTLLPTKVTVFSVVLGLQFCAAQTPRDQTVKNQESAKQFVQAVYSRYGPNGDPPSLFEESAGAVFQSSLIALAREDERAVGPGNSGVIDYDPVCNCQDTDHKFEHFKLQIESVDESACRASVSFTDQNGLPETLVLVLRKENEEWRIYDIENHGRHGHPSLRAALEKEIQRLSGENKVR